MKRKYANLRIEALRNAAGPAAVGAAALLLDPGEALAGVFNLPNTVHAGAAGWYVSNSTLAVTGPAGLGIAGAIIPGFSTGPPTQSPPIHTAYAFAHHFAGAYSGAFLITVNGAVFKNPTGTVDLTGTTLTSSPIVMSGLTTSVQFYFDTSTPTIRAVYSFTNNGATPITASIQWQNYLGYSAGSPIVTTSSGGSSETAADRWVITVGTGQPYIDSVRYGPGAADTPTAIAVPSASSNYLIDQYSLTVPAGQTRMLMFFGRLSPNYATAISASGTFNSTSALASAGLLSGLTTQQESQIVNWNFPQTTVPAMGTFGLVLMAALLGAMGAKYLRWPVGHR
jgi:hypothetical protein